MNQAKNLFLKNNLWPNRSFRQRAIALQACETLTDKLRVLGCMLARSQSREAARSEA